MSRPIEDYALIGDCQTAALVAKSGSIDWLCLPRFDSGACFAALLGTEEHGRWLIAPAGEVKAVRRRYRGGTLILETEFETEHGVVALIDFMAIRREEPDLVRIVEGRRGKVPMKMHLVIRTDYGSIVPWVRKIDRGLRADAGPDTIIIDTSISMRGEDLTTVAEFEVQAGQQAPFVLTWHPSHLPSPAPIDPRAALGQTERWWREWSDKCQYEGQWCEAVTRSLITLKALTFAPTGGIVAAPTTSLPEEIGGVRNWDYRYCWVRDATFTLYSLVNNGYIEEAKAWREWLLRAVAGKASQLNIMYGLSGERRLTEITIDWLPGYGGSKPVRVGNAAWEQFQLDVFGELMDALHVARRQGLEPTEYAWYVETSLIGYLESAWHEPDEGIWEVRGPRRHFTHSKVMAWVALDRMIKDAEHFHLEGPVDRWKAVRQEIHDEVCAKGYDAERNTFVQYYGSRELDASLLMIPLVGFLPPEDPRVEGTIDCIQKYLSEDGFVHRYSSHGKVDGLPGSEAAFLPCSFWLVDCLEVLGRHDEARALFEKLLAIRNDVGLLAEEYDAGARRQLGNFPQAFTHVGLVNSALNLSRMPHPAEERPRD